VGRERRRGGLKAGFRKLALMWVLNCDQANAFIAVGKPAHLDFVAAQIHDFSLFV